MKITPINGRILVKRVKKSHKSSILLINDLDFEPFYMVIAIASDILCDQILETSPNLICFGDMVYIEKYAQMNAVEEFEDHFIVKEENVTAVVE